MTERSATGRRRRWTVPMVGRAPDEEHRAATPLELFFDLVFVVAVAQASDRLHHAIAEGGVGEAVLGYLLAFFAVWWAWMNFTWFASAYDTDDVAYRLAVFVQLAGALVIAAGVPRAFEARDFGLVTPGIDHATDHAELGRWGAGMAGAAPVAIYLLALWALHYVPRTEAITPRAVTPLVAGLVLLTPLTGQAVPLSGALLAVLSAYKIARIAPSRHTRRD